MKPEQKPFFSRTFRSFGFAFKGIAFFLKSPSNAWIHLAAAFLVCAAGFYVHISKGEWMAVIFAIAFVFVTEMVNTAIEKLTDLVSPDYNELAGKVKDIAAGAVLLASIAAVVIACMVFVPYAL
jgi:diacylglycerol kinase (ATP)